MSDNDSQLKRDLAFAGALTKFVKDQKTGDLTSEMHGFASGWIARREVAGADERQRIEEGAVERAKEAYAQWCDGEANVLAARIVAAVIGKE